MTDVRLPATLGDLVAHNPAAGRVLDAFGLDYCCHGDQTLDAACVAGSIDRKAVHAVLDQLDQLEKGDQDGDPVWMALEPPALADHIVETHHRYLHEELPQLDALAAKVLDVHGSRHPELTEVRRLVSQLRAELEPHMLKEERILFPAIAALAAGRRDFPFGSIANPI